MSSKISASPPFTLTIKFSTFSAVLTRGINLDTLTGFVVLMQNNRNIAKFTNSKIKILSFKQRFKSYFELFLSSLREAPLDTPLNHPRTGAKSSFGFGWINPLSQLVLPQIFAVDLGNTAPINSLTVSCEHVHTSRFFCVPLPLSTSWENTPTHRGSGKQTRGGIQSINNGRSLVHVFPPFPCWDLGLG